MNACVADDIYKFKTLSYLKLNASVSRIQRASCSGDILTLTKLLKETFDSEEDV